MFSIIIPSYNRNLEVNRLLVSLEQQTAKNFDVIVVDDCSPNPLKIDRTFSFEVKLIRNEQNAGPAQSRNNGAKMATGEWLLFLDDDDRFDERKCQIIAETIEQNPTLNFIYHPAKCEMVNEKFSYVTKPINEQEISLERILLVNKIGGMPMIAIKKDFFWQLGGLSTALKSLEDYEFVLKAVSCPDFRPKYIDEPLSICAFHTKRSSVSTNTENTEKAIAMIGQQYVKTEQQAKNFAINSLYMLAYPYAMNLSRKAGYYYFKIFMLSHNVKHLMIAIVSSISPQLAINLKRYI
ncbi:glycosyltransferase family 2 protein [Lonepinella sp. MS14437]|uniref:glycosyltransferase family 2 protein n=1 Tax=Lonepinella sp. MS14437 TaxID=3003620 RepID=UPI0036DCD8ED